MDRRIFELPVSVVSEPDYSPAGRSGTAGAALAPALSQGERGFRGSGFGPGGPCRQVIATGLPMEPVPPLIGSGANT